MQGTSQNGLKMFEREALQDRVEDTTVEEVDNSTDNSQVDDTNTEVTNESEIDSSVELTASVGETINPNTATETESEKINPVYNEALNGIPQEFHKKLVPVFKKWDENNNSRFEKVQQEYAPYKVLAENNVSIDDVKNAFALRAKIESDPESVFKLLAGQLGYDLDEGTNSQGLDSTNEEEDNSSDITKNPQFQQVAQQTEQISQFLTTQQQEQERQAFIGGVTRELNELQQKHGDFNKDKVVEFAIMESERTGKEVSIAAGFKAYMDFRDEVLKSSVNKTAPDVYSGAGALASGAVNPAKLSEEERDAYVMKRMAALQAQKNN